MNRPARILTVATLAATLFACNGGASTGDTSRRPLAFFEPGPEALGSALLGGVLIFEDGCVYIDRAGERTFVAFPAGTATWREDRTAIFFEGAWLAPGAPVTLAGMARPASVALSGADGCDTAATWLASNPGPTVS